MDGRSGRVLLVMASCVFAGLLWAASGLTELAGRPSGSRASVPTGAASNARRSAGAASDARRSPGATSDVRPRNPASVDLASMAPVSLAQQAYSMAAPVFLSDPEAAHAGGVAVGDVSGDGRDDLVFLSPRYAANPAYDRMEIYVAYQRDDGSLDAAFKIAETGYTFAYQVLIADLDGNGAGEIITTIYNGVVVLRSNADGSFASSTAMVGESGVMDLIATDVDRDGYLDVLADSSNLSASVVHGNSRGVIDRISTVPVPASAVRTTGDVTGDGLDDLILGTIFNRPLEEFRVYPALASGGYAAPVVLSLPLGSNHTSSLAVGDFNGDGRGDLALDEVKDIANVHLYFQDPQGHLTSSLDIARQSGSGNLIASDLNRDGRTDLAFAHTGWGYVGYYLQTSTGFTPENVIQAQQYHGRKYYFAAGDLNHDRCGDLVISRGSQSPVLLYGQGCPVKRRAPVTCRYQVVAVDGSLEAASLASPLPSRQRAATPLKRLVCTYQETSKAPA